MVEGDRFVVVLRFGVVVISSIVVGTVIVVVHIVVVIVPISIAITISIITTTTSLPCILPHPNLRPLRHHQASSSHPTPSHLLLPPHHLQLHLRCYLPIILNLHPSDHWFRLNKHITNINLFPPNQIMMRLK